MSFFSAILSLSNTTFSPLTLNPYLWETGSGYDSTIGTWVDSSINAHNGSQITSGFRPSKIIDSNGVTVVNFDGIDDNIDLQLTGSEFGQNSFELYFGIAPLDGQPSTRQVIFGNEYINFAIETNGKITFKYGNAIDGVISATSKFVYFTDGVQINNLIRIVVDYSRSVINIYGNEILLELDATNNGDITSLRGSNFNPANNIYLGCLNNSGTSANFYSGYIYDLICYANNLSLSNANLLFDYFYSTGDYTTPTYPTEPSNLVLTQPTYESIKLDWTDNSTALSLNNELLFKIERSTFSTSGFTQIATVTTGIVTYTDSGLTANTYYYRVRAWANAGHSAYLTTVSSILVGLDTDANIIINEMISLSATPTITRKNLINNFVLTMKSDISLSTGSTSNWMELDALWMFAAPVSGSSIVNWKNPTGNKVLYTVAPTFTSDKGIAGNGTTQFANLNWNSSTNGVNFTRDNASFGIYNNTAAATGENRWQMGGGTNGIQARTVGDKVIYACNAAGITSTATSSDKRQLWHVVRPNSTQMVVGRNGIPVETGSTASLALSNNNWYACGFNNAGSLLAPSTSRIATINIGSGQIDYVKYYTCLTTFLTAIGANV